MILNNQVERNDNIMQNSNEYTKSVDRLKKIIFNEDFLNKLMTLKKIEDVKNLFSDNGIEISDEELNLIGQYLKKYISCNDESSELNEKDLEYVSGGVCVLVKTAGKIISIPFAIAGYGIGSIPTALIRGIHDGAVDTWYSE